MPAYCFNIGTVVAVALLPPPVCNKLLKDIGARRLAKVEGGAEGENMK